MASSCCENQTFWWNLAEGDRFHIWKSFHPKPHHHCEIVVSEAKAQDFVLFILHRGEQAYFVTSIFTILVIGFITTYFARSLDSCYLQSAGFSARKCLQFHPL
jgi:hypothetical protein